MKFSIQFLSIIFCGFFFTVSAQNNQDVKINIEKLTDHVYMLVGQGGNIGVSVGDDGVFVIDDQFARLSPKIISAIRTLSDKPIKFLANTHWHGDHTGGNVNFQKEGAIIMAHQNVRKRLEETPRRDKTMRPKEALPVITFNDKLSLYINGEQVAIFHIDNAHTDGDALLYFTESNVLHTGDTFFKGRYPYIDTKSGGSIKGYIEAVKGGLMVVDEDTKIIPGHGSKSNKEEYKTFLKMLQDITANIASELEKGKSEDDVAQNSKLTKVYDNLGYGSGFINSERFRRTVYKSLKMEM